MCFVMGYKLSPSALNLMGECPRCFWLTHHGVWKRPSGIFLSLPSGMDRIFRARVEGKSKAGRPGKLDETKLITRHGKIFSKKGKAIEI